MIKFVPFLFLIAGIYLLVQVALPVINFKYLEKVYASDDLPLISPQKGRSNVLGVSIQNTNNSFSQFISENTRTISPNYSSFNISIPSIGLFDSPVQVDSNDLSLGLIQLPGTALPGEKGNLFVTGHSMLPQLAGKDEKALFAKLPNVKKGDEVKVWVKGSEYTYKIISIKVVKPEDISVISPPDNTGRYITLMTCVPPGLNTKRLVVLGKLI